MNPLLAPERDPDVWKGIAAGVIGGICASWAMVQFQKLWNDGAQQSPSKPLHEHNVPEHRVEAENADDQAQHDDATVRMAEAVIRRPLSEEEKKVAGPAVHYSFGAFLGALYGAAAELVPGAHAGAGLPFGAAVFVGADEIAVPALGFSPWANQVPFSKHMYGLASHLVYGATTELVRRAVRSVLNGHPAPDANAETIEISAEDQPLRFAA